MVVTECKGNQPPGVLLINSLKKFFRSTISHPTDELGITALYSALAS